MSPRSAQLHRRAERWFRFGLGIGIILMVVMLVAEVPASVPGTPPEVVNKDVRIGIGAFALCSFCGLVLIRALHRGLRD